jgi:hypothetical protein
MSSSSSRTEQVLERRYRRLLRLLPKHYRQARGEELLGALMEGVLMEGAGKRRRWPEVREVLSLAGLSVRTRWSPARADGGEQSASHFGETARALALLGSAVLTLSAVTQLVVVEVVYGSLFVRLTTFVHVKGVRSSPYGPFEIHSSYLMTLHRELPVLWLAVYVLLAAGWWPAARILAVALLGFAATDVTGVATVASEQLLLAAVTTGAALVARGPATRRVTGRRTRFAAASLPAVAIGVLAVSMVDIGIWVNDNPQRLGRKAFRELSSDLWVSPDTPWAVFATVALFIAVAVLAFRSAAWPLAVAVVGLASLGLLAAQTYSYDSMDINSHPVPESGGVPEATAIVGGLVAVALFALIRERLTGAHTRRRVSSA